MAHIMVVANQKGGVGKSTTTVHSAFHFAGKGKVCMVDMDGQGNATSTMREADCHIYDVGASALFHDDSLNFPEPESNIAVIPADDLLNDIESLELEVILNPAKHLRSIEWADYIIIDTPPSLGRRLLGALVAADHVLSPIEPTGYATDGLEDLLTTINMVKERFNPDLNFLGVLANKVHATSKSQREFMGMLIEGLGSDVIPQMIGNRVSVSDAVDSGRPSWDMMSRGGKTAGQEFKKAFEHIEERMGLIEREN
jgi:chromosome partitioning protein